MPDKTYQAQWHETRRGIQRCLVAILDHSQGVHRALRSGALVEARRHLQDIDRLTQSMLVMSGTLQRILSRVGDYFDTEEEARGWLIHAE
jgi:hypothetical protein